MNDILKARLDAIDADCESIAKIDLDKLFETASHDNNNTKHSVPSPQAVEAIWLKLITRKEHEFIDEIARTLKPESAGGSTIQPVVPDEEFVSTVEAMVDTMFAEDRYVDRMRDFYHLAARKAPVDEPSSRGQAKRPDLIDTAYRTGIQNALQRTRQTVLREFDLYKPLKAPENTGFLSQWHHYSTLSPLRSFGAIVMLSLTSYLIAFIIASDSFRGLLESFGWSTGTGL
ncbi:MAG: hypothetical protein ABI284_05480 [Nitrosospira sp.]